ncbi:MAG: exonuclease domain-containing protein [Myxococcota bacterium]
MKHPILRIEPIDDERYAVSDLELPGFSRRRLWVFDLEATGLDTAQARITQIAGLPIERGRILEDEAFVQYVNPGKGVEMPREVEELTGITLAMLKDAPSLPEAWAAHLEAARGCELWIGQSVFEYDVPLLEAELARHALPVTLPPTLDSVVLATALLGEPEARWSTTALVQRFGVSTEGLRRHDALDDVKILARILLPMIAMIREEHGDRVHLPPDRPLTIKRHPPVTSSD